MAKYTRRSGAHRSATRTRRSATRTRRSATRRSATRRSRACRSATCRSATRRSRARRSATRRSAHRSVTHTHKSRSHRAAHTHRRAIRRSVLRRGAGEIKTITLNFETNIYTLPDAEPILNPTVEILDSITARLDNDVKEFFINDAVEQCNRELRAGACPPVSLTSIQNNNNRFTLIFNVNGATDNNTLNFLIGALKSQITRFQYDDYDLNFGTTLSDV